MRKEVFGITEEWQTADLITDHPRTLKKMVRQYNNDFGKDKEHEWYIVSGSKGYRLTQDKDEILQSIHKEEKLAKIRFKQMKRRLNRAMNYFSQNERLPI